MDFLYRHDTNGFCHFGLHFLSQLWIQNFRSTTPLFIKNFLLVDMLSCDWPINCTWIQLWKVADAWWIIGEIRSSSNDHQSLIANSFFHASTSIEWFDLKKVFFPSSFWPFWRFLSNQHKRFFFLVVVSFNCLSICQVGHISSNLCSILNLFWTL